MKIALAAVLLATLAACERQPSKLDKIAESPMARLAPPSGDVETRLRRVEEMLAKREEAFAFLDMAYEQTMEQQTRPTPDGVYGVDIAQNIALGQFEGSPSALVTIIEAWDFA